MMVAMACAEAGFIRGEEDGERRTGIVMMNGPRDIGDL